MFATLQHDASIIANIEKNARFSSSFQSASLMLLLIVAVFTVYANSLFLSRRSKEIGLYQLIGLTKRGVARFLLIENALLGFGALLFGIGCGALVYRIFLLLLIKLLGFEGIVSVKFSLSGVTQTVAVFAALIVITSIQMLRKVYRNTLIDLFHAEKQNEHPAKPTSIAAAILALLAIALIAYGYQHSGHLSDDTLLLDMFLILVSTIAGTYLLFRVTISWLFYRYRRGVNGHLELKFALSLAPLMHRMKAQANSLTLITVLSAMTLTMVAVAYSIYVSAGNDTRIAFPYDFVIQNGETNAKMFSEEMNSEGIRFVHKQVEAVKLVGTIRDHSDHAFVEDDELLFLPAEQLQNAGADMKVPQPGEAVIYNGRAKLESSIAGQKYTNFPKEVELNLSGSEKGPQVLGLIERYAMNYDVYGLQLVTSESTVRELKERMIASPQYEEEKTRRYPRYETITLDTFQVPDKEQRVKASDVYAKYVAKGDFVSDYERQYRNALQDFGMFIFIAGFLGLLFLISTGSILYFKQMTEADQEKSSFITLRQLGFETKDIMKGIVRKQLFVFAIPLVIGISHAIFAVKTVSIAVVSNIAVPSAIAMGVYLLIYIVFILLTIGYYKKIVQNAM
ncbi:ABC transporter permease [Bacillus sp. 3255]|uniref:ABC transporter permease n=1 Tax=Bacillus sp. 3255 TaxID=2817904 RepID=UPI00285AF1E4|nr:ABC transporter permease [Bacillus sp. 3255]MDR6885231.1 bacitracin transport system permease protein [Bacillus sp. 3255]